jgi:hypothetical protein
VRKPKSSPRNKGPGCKSPFQDLTGRSGGVFFLDILSHRMSVIVPWVLKKSL